MKPTFPVDLIVYAIATQEGELSSHTRNNPGNLRYSGQHGATRPDGYTGPVRADEPVAQFDTWVGGIIALYRQIWLQVAMGQTVRQIVSQFAPPNENDTAVYIADVAKWTGLALDTPVRDLLPPLVRMNG